MFDVNEPHPRHSLLEIAFIFLRLGSVAFGGPAAHIAMMRTEFVDHRKWLTQDEFLDIVGASNLMPGPGSTEVAIFIGSKRRGLVGLIVAGVCFISPAALIVACLAWGYERFGHLPGTRGILYGVQPVVIAVIAQALWTMGQTAIKNRLLILAAVAAFALSFAGIAPVVVLFGTGCCLGAIGWFRNEPRRNVGSFITLLGVSALLIGLPVLLTLAEPPAHSLAGPGSVLLVFLKIGSVVYGSGYVLLSFLRADLVSRLHWLTTPQLLDAVAVGQLTPGPVFTAATFIGYLVGGPIGAVCATVGIFTPAFVLVAMGAPVVSRLRSSPPLSAFLDGVNVAALALMFAVEMQLARVAVIDLLSAVMFLLSVAALIHFRLNSVWLLAAGAAIGLIAHH